MTTTDKPIAPPTTQERFNAWLSELHAAKSNWNEISGAFPPDMSAEERRRREIEIDRVSLYVTECELGLESARLEAAAAERVVAQ